MSRRLRLLIFGALAGLCNPAYATESVDCWSDGYSLTLVLRQEDYTYIQFHFRKGEELQDANQWKVKSARIEVEQQTIEFFAEGRASNTENLQLAANGPIGILNIGKLAQRVRCTWFPA